MYKLGTNAALLGVFLLVGCVSQIKTNSTYDPSVNFGVYRTFAQAPPPSYAAEMPGYSEITGRQVQEQIAANLQQKGLQPASWDEADLQVRFSLGGQARQESDYWGEGWGDGWGWGGPGEVTTENYVEGSLVIDIADRVGKRLVWHGYGTEAIFSDDVEVETLTGAVDAILEKYPPAAESGQPASEKMPEPPKVKADDMKEAGAAP